MDENPYAATLIEDEDDSAFLAIRKHYESQELAIRLIGCSFLAFGLICLSSVDFTPDFDNRFARQRWIILTVIGGFMLILILGVAYGLLTLKKRARLGATLWCILQLFAFPIGSIISIYCFYILWGSKSDFIFSSAYRVAMAKTPDFRLRPNKSNWTSFIPCSLILIFVIYYFLLKK